MYHAVRKSNQPANRHSPVNFGARSLSRLLRLVIAGLILVAWRRTVARGQQACDERPSGTGQETDGPVRERAAREGFALVLFLLVAFVPLAFSEDFIAAFSDVTRTQSQPGLLVVVDAGLLTFLFLLTIWLQKPTREEERNWDFAPWWIGGAALTLAVDMALTRWIERDSVWIEIGSSVLYILSLALIVAATVGVNPSRARTQSGSTRIEWARFRPLIPLLVGTLAAYVGTILWGRFLLGDDVARTISEAQLMAERIGLNADQTTPEGRQALDALCSGAIHQEYFAQISQIIPLLLVGLGIEANFFRELLTKPVQREITIVTVVILAVAEASAISALTEPNQGCGDILFGWHEYAAFIITVEASFAALALLVWALVVVRHRADAKT